jgi:hypothetical protein
MKRNKIDEIWEDEESKKIQEAIRRNYIESKKEKAQKREDKKTLAIIILGAILFILAFALLLVKCNNDYKEAVQGCVDNGYSVSYCEYKYGR